jgi:hypothetical protein
MTNTTTAPAFELYVPTSREGLTHLHAENTTGILCGSTRRYSTFNVMGIVPAGSATCEPCNRAAHRLERDAEVRAGYNATGPCGVGTPAVSLVKDSPEQVRAWLAASATSRAREQALGERPRVELDRTGAPHYPYAAHGSLAPLVEVTPNTTKVITPAEYIALQRHDYAGDARTLLPETVATWREFYPDWNGQRWAMWWAGEGHGTTLGPVNVQ